MKLDKFKTDLNKLIIALLIGTTIYACKKDDKKVSPSGSNNEEELITSVDLIFTNTTTNAVDTFSFKDPDGEGGNAPTVFETIELDTSSTYQVSARFLDESDPNDVEDITEEIRMEDDEHIICFTNSGASGLSIQRTDTDGTYEVGLSSQWTTSSEISIALDAATVQVKLRHQPDGKDGSCTPGDTDVEINFPIIIE